MALGATAIGRWLAAYKAQRGRRKARRIHGQRFWKKSYAQFGEDRTIDALFPGRAPGFYVDVGCFHPRWGSNTRLLYERGWRGINIDVTEEKIATFRRDRPRDVNVLAAAYNAETEIEIRHFPDAPRVDTIDPDFAAHVAQAKGTSFEIRRVRARPLDAILAEADAPADFELLNIDVEMADAIVLEGIDLGRWRPKVIAVEVHGTGIEGVLGAPASQRVLAAGYELHAWVNPTLIFVRKGYDPFARAGA